VEIGPELLVLKFELFCLQGIYTLNSSLGLKVKLTGQREFVGKIIGAHRLIKRIFAYNI
jgi:hypothetical protein